MLLGLFPIVTFYIKGKVGFSDTARSFTPFLYLTAISSIYEFFGSLVAGFDVAIWFRIYGLLEFSALFYFFYHTLPRKMRWALYSLATVFFVEYTSFIFFFDTSEQLWTDGILNCTTFSLIIVGVLYYFIKRFKALQDRYVESDWPVFYFTGSLLLYYSSTFFLFLMANTVFVNNPEEFSSYWTLNLTSTIIFRGLLIFGVWKA